MTTFDAFARTDPGRERSRNEDSVLVTPTVLAVADGLGGHNAGDVASDLAVQAMAELAARASLTAQDVVSAVHDVNDRIVALAQSDPGTEGMATTLCGLALVHSEEGPRCLVFNVGDSRVYGSHRGEFVQISTDHSEVQELRQAGLLDDEAAAHYPRRNVITRCLGTQPAPPVDVWVFEPRDSDRFVLCSDGLSNELSDARIAELLDANPDSAPAVHALVDAALAAGGRDNVSVLVVRVRTDSETGHDHGLAFGR